MNVYSIFRSTLYLAASNSALLILQGIQNPYYSCVPCPLDIKQVLIRVLLAVQNVKIKREKKKVFFNCFSTLPHTALIFKDVNS